MISKENRNILIIGLVLLSLVGVVSVMVAATTVTHEESDNGEVYWLEDVDVVDVDGLDEDEEYTLVIDDEEINTQTGQENWEVNVAEYGTGQYELVNEDDDAEFYWTVAEEINGSTVWAGQEIDVWTETNNEEYGLYKVDDEEGDEFIRQVVSEDDRVMIDTALENDRDDLSTLEGTYELREGSDVVDHWNVQEHDINATFEEDEININTDEDNESTLEFDSNRSTSSVYVTIDNMEIEEFIEILDNSEIEYADSIGEEDDPVKTYELDEDEEVEVILLEDLDGESEELEMNFYDEENEEHLISEGEYNIEFYSEDAHVIGEYGEETVSFEAIVGSQGDASFSDSMYEQELGDVVEFTINLDETSTADVYFDDENYDFDFTVVDGSDDEQVTVKFNSYLAGQGAPAEYVYTTEDEDDRIYVDGEDITEEDVYDVELSSDYLKPDLYQLNLNVDDEEVHSSSLFFEYPSAEELEFNVMPYDTELSEFDDSATEREIVADQDMLVVEIESSGIFGMLDHIEDEDRNTDDHNDLLTGILDATEYDEEDAEYDEEDAELPEELDKNVRDILNLTIEEQDVDENRGETELNASDARNITIDEDENTLLLAYDTDELKWDGEDETEEDLHGFVVDSIFDVHFEITDEYQYAESLGYEEGETIDELNLENEIDYVERDVTFNHSTVDVEESDLENRYGIEVPGVDEEDESDEDEVDEEDISVVNAETHVAPHTEISTILTADAEYYDEPNPPIYETDEETVTNIEVEGEVDSDGDIESEYDLTNVEVDRFMNVEIRGNQAPNLVEETDFISTEQNTPPVIESIDVETSVTVDEEVSFSADVEDVDEVDYEWDFDDGETSESESPTHIFEDVGTYDVELTVTDSEGQEDSETVEIVVDEEDVEPPEILDISVPSEVEAGEEMTAFADVDGENLEITWDFDNGDEATGSIVNQTYNEGDSYEIEIEALDTETGETDTESANIIVTEEDEGDEEYELTVNTTTVDDEELATTITVDGEEETGTSATFELEDGEYEVTADADEYEETSANVEIDGEDEEIDLTLDEEDENGDENGDDGDDGVVPDQPGFGVVIALMAIIASAGIAMHKRE